MHTLARFLFASLLNQHTDLAFKVGLRAMRLPILEECGTGELVLENMGMIGAQNYPRDNFAAPRFSRFVNEIVQNIRCSVIYIKTILSNIADGGS